MSIDILGLLGGRKLRFFYYQYYINVYMGESFIWKEFYFVKWIWKLLII